MSPQGGLKLRYIGHSAVQLTSDAGELLIDPFVSSNPVADVDVGELRPDYIYVTHAHFDHWGDTEAIAKGSGATVIATAEISAYAAGLGLKSLGMNIGGSWTFGFGTLKLTPAWHSSSFPDGRYGGMPTGAVIGIGGKTVYHAGDTALFSDMSLIGRSDIDVALLPIGDNFTMGPDDAIEAVKLIAPKLVIPIHFGTFGLIEQDGDAFAERVKAETSADAICLVPGQTLDL